jgi:hypothetical protein
MENFSVLVPDSFGTKSRDPLSEDLEGALHTVSRSRVGVFICSSDSRSDILERVLPSIFKYWPDCPYPIYVGVNTSHKIWPGITSLVAKASEWRKECLEQVAQMSETHLIVVLDDFLFQERVDQSRLSMFVSKTVNSDLPYLRLLPLGKSLTQRLMRLPRAGSVFGVEAIGEGRPFYSGLQIAIWNKAHFSSLLELQGSIWDFEHQQRPGVSHYAITNRAPITYRHLVEKGRWLPYAKSLLEQTGLSTDLGTRPILKKWMSFRLLLDAVRYYVLGYANH